MKCRNRKQYADESAVPVSSMIDIVFLLIIFFVVTIDIDREVADQEITLPSVAHGIPLKVKKSENLTINLRKNGNITIDGTIISLEQLQILMKSVAEKWGSRHSIVIRGDNDVTFHETNKIICLLAEYAFGNVSFQAELKKQE